MIIFRNQFNKTNLGPDVLLSDTSECGWKMDGEGEGVREVGEREGWVGPALLIS